MKINRSQLPSLARFAIREWLSITLVALLTVSSTGFAKPRGGVSPRKLGATSGVVAAAPLAGLIEVNTTGDGDNLNQSVGCDTDPATPGDQCSLRAAIQRASALAGDDEIRFKHPDDRAQLRRCVG